MTGTSITNGYAAGYNLTAASQTPFTIDGGASIGGNGVNGALYAYGVGNYTWAITNYGVVNGTGVNGIQLGTKANYANGGSVTNQTDGQISGGVWGIAVFASAPVYVVNYANATISGTSAGAGGGVYQYNEGTVTNSGVIKASTLTSGAYGVLLKAGGQVINNANALIQGFVGVYLGSSVSTVVNDGSIGGAGNGIQLGSQADVIKSTVITNQTAGAVSGGTYGVAIFNGAPATVLNFGMITTADTTSGAAVYIEGRATVDNYGVISTPSLATGGAAVRMANGGAIDNANYLSGTATIQGALGAYIYSKAGGASASVTNDGIITGLVTDGVKVGGSNVPVAGGFVTNLSGGSISGGAFGLRVYNTGLVTIANQSGATISGANAGPGGGVFLYDPGTVTNSGLITAPGGVNGFGVHFENGGVLINTLTSGTPTIQGFTGVYLGDYALATASTLINDGSIAGASGDGVQLGSGAYSNGSGTISNQSNGSIAGAWGVEIYNTGASYVVNASNATISGIEPGADGGVYLLGSGTVSNSGMIDAPTSGAGAYGVHLKNGGQINNAQGATIIGYVGAYIGQSGGGVHASAIDSTGKIVGTGNAVQFGKPGTSIQSASVTNETGGSIAGGNYAVGIFNIGASSVINDSGATISGTNAAAGDAIYMLHPGIVTNHGVIKAAVGRSRESGVYLPNGGVVLNDVNATIEGNRGVYLGRSGVLANASTLTNLGTIIAAVGDDAVYFGSQGPTSRLIVGTSAAFTGSIVGGGATMELQAATAPASILGFGVTISNFSTVTLDSANWTVGGNEAGLEAVSAIDNFASGDTIDVSDFAAVGYTFNNDVMTLTAADTSTMTLKVDVPNGTGFNIGVYGPGGTQITECFAAGTRIATPAGERTVETLAAGDRVLAEFAGEAPIQWIGHRHVDCTRHPDPATVWPVRVSAGAFGPKLPVRDLLLSPNHAVFVDGALIPVKHLINGVSVVQTPVDTITYYHIELAEHDLLFAEGQPAESYLDVGDRSNFANGGGAVCLHPDFSRRPYDAAARWELHGCAPLLLHGPLLAAVRDRVAVAANAALAA